MSCGPPEAPYDDIAIGRMYDALDLRRQSFERVLHLYDVSVPIIDSANARDRVTEATFGDVRVDPGAAEKAAGRAAQIVQAPAGNARRAVELPLRPRETGHAGDAI
jgi:hypothetical protein